ncbi:hypothetical protein EMIHUDRAFT_449943 [Emiliania huxleyi CCMP1516]|uniref:Guanylate kinase-like domain-containing protein n=2 Tax=Emiliania huxleyi TaxID=2903 RepID=A0A0D3JXV9_EMIH1|nr:hypothetical protein EMIHUDRAFT_449943 [Emiliania huxleyi CCMP1516]EOD28344.1 hypothetical protein EMIHUDRAFT_449943 [Emiliania huxleyi CCMP1516]|eukprot:XP_005780773.1 hypothetical protein EMIHUDRAFT_449943 [Emiliania huxleyi CCMP1516]
MILAAIALTPVAFQPRLASRSARSLAPCISCCDSPPTTPPRERSTEVDARGFVVPQVGDVVKMPSKWPGEWEVAQVDFVQAVGSRSTVEVDLLPLKSIGDGLYRLSGRKPAAVRADIAKLGRLDSEYVREVDGYRVDERQLQPIVPRPAPNEATTQLGLEEYAKLKAEILIEAALVGAAGAAVCYAALGSDGAAAFGLGSLAGCTYLALLSTEIDMVGPSGEPPPKALQIAASGRLLLPVALMVGLTAARGGGSATALSLLPRETFFAAAAGFLSYKAPLLAKQVARGLQDLSEAGKEKAEAAAADASSGGSEPLAPQQLVLAGPSGVGKSTLVAALLQAREARRRSLAASVSPSREVEGEDYRFVSTSEFDAMVERGEFIEWATIGGHRYGTTVASVQALAAEGKVCVLDVDAIAARSDLRPYCVWVAPPSFGALRERLTERGTESEEEISRRVLRAREEIEFSLTTRCFDKVIVNDDFDAASRELREAVLEALAPSA